MNHSLKCWSEAFFHLPKFLLLLLDLLTFIFHKVVQKRIYHVVGYIVTTLLQIVCRVRQPKNFGNQSIICEDIDKSKVARFYGPRYILLKYCILLHRQYTARLVQNIIKCQTKNDHIILTLKLTMPYGARQRSRLSPSLICKVRLESTSLYTNIATQNY